MKKIMLQYSCLIVIESWDACTFSELSLSYPPTLFFRHRHWQSFQHQYR
uniref:Uncharacterized protein n=1 Tax=Brassica oleracea TaxID=3712 RepID=A0A3P6DPQ9_BRAOL|nr:unnamed protein product [Brassica oleracea]